ncbi:MAG: DUF1801 domain-containing protein [Gammaproteobacteria bacterium]|nr:DUF1801 domain-containing protein [Gammaproteobacteria bacterium]
MARQDDFDAVYAALRKLMLPYAKHLVVVKDEPGSLYLDTQHIMKNRKPLFFGAIQIKKNYVSYHLMPVYVNPALLDDTSAELKKRMQGKSCFNFTSVDKVLFSELGRLTKNGFNFYRKEGYI